MRQKLLASAMALAMVLSLTPVTALAAEDEAIPETVPAVDVTATEEAAETTGITVSNGITVTDEGNYTVPAGTANATITISGAVTMTGTGNAFTINADTTLVFGDDASLTLSGYTNGFVVSNATLSGGGWVINDGDGMYLFKLNTGGKLNITGNVDLNGKDKTEATASRAIFLPWGTSGQAVTLGENVTLAANNFYRGMETGGASNYTISGAWMNSSEFDFSGNNCGMALSYFDSNARFENCTLEVSNCDASGIFMRQDNAALDGLYIDNVKINCVNDIDLDQTDIAIRFHSNNFEITDSIINIENAWNTGLWICDGWNANPQNEISGTIITIKHVEDSTELSTYGTVNRRKAMTFVPFRDWLISDCQITIDGTSPASIDLDDEENEMEGGVNIASDIHVSASNGMKAKPGMCGGTIIIQDTSICTSGVIGADVGVQIGQFLEIGQNTMIDNGGAENHFTVLCDSVENGYPGILLGMITMTFQYDTSDLTIEQQSPDRVTVTGGSYRSTRDEDLAYLGQEKLKFYDESIPVNGAGEDLTMFKIAATDFEEFAPNGTISVPGSSSDETSYTYSAQTVSPDNFYYLWLPTATVTFEGSGETIQVARGMTIGLTGDSEIPTGNWTYNGQPFTADTVVSGDIIVSAAQ